MKGILVSVLALAFLVSLGTVALAQQTDRRSTTMERGTTAEGLPEMSQGQLVTQRATIQAIDPANRVVSLKTPEGKTKDVRVPAEVRNFSQLKVGDQVTARYYESVAVEVRKPGEGPSGMSQKEAMTRAKPGEKPAGAAARQTTITTKVESIAADKSSVTLKGPMGHSMDVKVRDPKSLQNVKAGDQVTVTYTEAMAVSVDKARA